MPKEEKPLDYVSYKFVCELMAKPVTIDEQEFESMEFDNEKAVVEHIKSQKGFIYN